MARIDPVRTGPRAVPAPPPRLTARRAGNEWRGHRRTTPAPPFAPA